MYSTCLCHQNRIVVGMGIRVRVEELQIYDPLGTAGRRRVKQTSASRFRGTAWSIIAVMHIFVRATLQHCVHF